MILNQLYSYSSNVSKVAIVSKEPLEASIGRVVRCFSPVVNRNLRPTIFPSDVYDSSRFMTKTVVKTFKDEASIEIEFPFYDQARLTDTKVSNPRIPMDNTDVRHSLDACWHAVSSVKKAERLCIVSEIGF